MTVIQAAINAFVYISATIATLRAGSRALYLLQNGSIGTMDGPLILGPQDVLEDGMEVSSLWESTYGFQQAVLLSTQMALWLSSDENNMNGRIDSSLSTSSTSTQDSFKPIFQGNIVQTTTTNELFRASYLLSAPHKTKQVQNMNNKSTFTSPSFLKPSSSTLEIEDKRELTKRGFWLYIWNLGHTFGYGGRSKTDEDKFVSIPLEDISPPTNGNDMKYNDNNTSEQDYMDSSDIVNNVNLTKGYITTTQLNPISTPTTHTTIPNSNEITSIRETTTIRIPIPFIPKISKAISRTVKRAMNLSRHKRQGIEFPNVHSRRHNQGMRRVASMKEYQQVISTVLPIPCIQSNTNNDDGSESIQEEQKKRYANVKVFAPQVFSRLRSRFGIQEDDYLKSIVQSGPFVSFQSNSKGAARSGGFFFFTRDGAYMIKTIKKAEIHAMLEMLPKYDNFMSRNARRSLLAKCCGMYGVQISTDANVGSTSFENNDEEDYVFLVMNNVYPAEASSFISERFDLKGSTVGRECTQEEIDAKGSKAVLKDLNLAKEVYTSKTKSLTFQERTSLSGINIGARAKSNIMSQLRKDISLLIECGVMDYSLLVGIVNMDSRDNEKSLDCVEYDGIEAIAQNRQQRRLISWLSTPFITPMYIIKTTYNVIESVLSTVMTLPLPYYGAGFCGVDGGSLSIINGRRKGNRALYYFGVIDFLQPWTARKMLEKELKGVLGYDKTAISCVHPKDYAYRFIDFMNNHIK